ncbi:MAG: HEAT repeat domain-containing protein [Deltaproteobacteria bacterium]|nr:HEAT repeat domain-containing protein [Deltaproteobacteria bacterium]
MGDFDQVATLLHSEAPEKQVAAAIVLGELKVKSAAVTKGLLAMLDSPIPAVRRHGLDAFTQLGAAKAVEQIFPLLTSRDNDVREAAVRALASVGPEVVGKVKARLRSAAAEEKRALEHVLAELGGKEALATILANLNAGDEDTAKSVALAVRHQVKDADPKTRASYHKEILRFLKSAKAAENRAAVLAAVKIVGFLEQPNTAPLLLRYATQTKWGMGVREEAITALRFVKPSKAEQNKIGAALLALAQGDDASLARAALLSLGHLALSPALAAELGELATHPDLERARFAIEQLGNQESTEGLQALVGVVAVQDRTRAELAGDMLKKRPEAAPLLARALEKVEDPERAWLLQKILRPHAGRLSPKERLRLVENAVDKLAAGKRGWEAQLQAVKDADPNAVAGALRELVSGFMKAKKEHKAVMVARVLCRSDQASADDRFLCAALELATGRLDTHPTSRSRDPALKSLAQLAASGFDVAKAAKASKLLSPEVLYYAGFHFVEEGHPLGEELLADVVKVAGRTKVGKMAKNKLDLALKNA